MTSSSQDARDPLLEALRALPTDSRNTAPETRARFEYQDECIALTLLEHLADQLVGVLVEHSTDVILIPRQGLPELVSIKHREPHHSSEPAWTWPALHKDRVLIDLHGAWLAAGKACTVAFLMWPVVARRLGQSGQRVRAPGGALGGVPDVP
ncbi:hypothetical protein MTF65_05435 [Streptomyces sp. APSN-46.1]|uniref:hypothetical protein n=1 Tax=Streptomyces sp. APSN-46.1 TaxID=2929049 RepID=UPI001FB509E6|nr:hypothetical protein [Streptomyces sp. APSN-46.1]MCJ1676799.1 hypothetical protein [Streptomyces sp. APSN-46.1]